MIFNICLVILLIWTPLYLLYWHVFRPIAARRVRYMLYASRDQLRLLVIEEKLGEHSELYPVLETACQCCLEAIDEWDFFDFCRHMKESIDRRSADRADRDIALLESAPPEIRRIYADLLMVTIAGMLLNSPLPVLLVVFCSGIFFLGYLLLHRFRAKWAAMKRAIWLMISGKAARV